VALAVTSLAVKRLDPDKRAGILAVAALLVLSTAQFIPFIGLAADGTGGRQFHLPGAFLGVLAGLVGASSRARGAALAVVVALAIATISTGSRSRDRWIATESVMRSIAGQIASIHANAKGNEYDLVVIPGTYGPMPFGLQATGGLITSPIQNPPVSNRVLVQVDTDIPGIATGFARGIIANLRRLPLDALDSRGVEGAPEYPSRVFCWVPKQPSLVELPPAPDASPAAWAQATRAAMKAAHCAGSFG